MPSEPPPLPPPVATSVHWFLRHHDHSEHGPFDWDAIKQSEALGRIAEDTELKHPTATGGQWVRAFDVLSPAGSVSRAPPSPPERNAKTPKREHSRKRSRGQTIFRHWPKSPGKRIVAIAFLLWVVGLPLCWPWGIAEAHAGVRNYNDQAYVIPQIGLSMQPYQMRMREDAFVDRNIKNWSTLCGIIGLAGLVLNYVSPTDCRTKSLE